MKDIVEKEILKVDEKGEKENRRRRR